jgi:lipoprotein-releasing system permease protein
MVSGPASSRGALVPAWRAPYELFLALRYLRFHRGRTFISLITLISVGGVAVGTTALVLALALWAGFVEDLRERIHSGSAHLTVMSTLETRFEGSGELVRTLEKTPGVAAAASVLYTPAMLTREGSQETGFAELQGVDPTAHAHVIHGAALADDDPFLRLAERGPEGIVLGAELALSLGVWEGDRVRAIVPEVTLSPWAPVPRSRVFEVVAVYRSGHFQQDSQRAYVTLEAASALLRAEGRSSWIELRLDQLDELQAMKQRLRAHLGTPWVVIDLIEQNRDIWRALNYEKLLLFLAIGLIVAVAAMNIVSTLVLVVNDKVREIGTLCAMGARAPSIAVVFMLQGLIIGTLGTVAGLATGAALALGLDRFEVIRLNPEVYLMSHVPFALHAEDLVLVAAAAVVISFLATLYPALKAAGLRPVEAIRYE